MRSIRPRDVLAVLLVTYAFAVVQPVLDLVGQAPEFLVAHRLGGSGLLSLTVVFAAGPPLLAGAALVAVGRVAPAAARAATGAMAAGLVAVALLPVIDELVGARVRWVALIALVAGGGFAFAFVRSEHLRGAVRFGAFAPALFVGVFLLASPAAGLVRTAELGDHAMAMDAPPPVVMVVFDEFPTVSLLDDEGELDGERLPNIARFAARSTWYRRARTVAALTQHAVPALLTGRYPDADRQPIAAHHPTNLFTLLADDYDIHAVESLTDLCPASICADAEPRPPLGARLRALAADVRVIHGHAVLPAGLARHLPSMDSQWAGFGGGAVDVPRDFEEVAHEESHADPRLHLERFLDAITAADRPALHFLHVLLPHSPWRYLPDGQQVLDGRGAPGNEKGEWVGDRWQVAQAQQRHLMQVSYVDRFVGELMDRLERAGIDDETIVVLAADHGISFRPGHRRRTATEETFSELVHVPLFVRIPGQGEGEVVDRAVETVDVLPTIVAAIGAELPAPVDGVDLRATTAGSTATSDEGGSGSDRGGGARIWLRTGWREVDAEHADWWRPLRLRQEVLGPLPRGRDLFSVGRYGELVGTPVDEVTDGLQELGLRIEHPDRFVDLDRAAALLPAFVRGCVTEAGGSASEGDPAGAVGAGDDVVLTLNGVVAASTRVSVDEDGRRCLSAVLPPHLFRSGENVVRAYLVR